MFEKIAFAILRLNALLTILSMEAVKPVVQLFFDRYQMTVYDAQVFGQWIILQGGFNFSPSMRQELTRQIWIQVTAIIFLNLLINFIEKIFA